MPRFGLYPNFPKFKSHKKRILFVTGSRADFGKQAPLIEILSKNPSQFEVSIFVTGTHLLARHGYTITHVRELNCRRIISFKNQDNHTDMDTVLANTVKGLRAYLKENKTDLIVVHGDRVEAMAGALVGSLRNIHVAHIEGGEFSGTIDEALRHAVSKLAHTHFTSNQDAKKILMRLGEPKDRIHVIGSPDIDVMKEKLPQIDEVKKNCKIPFSSYAIAVLHPITTQSYEQTDREATIFFESLKKAAPQNFIVLTPNNDRGANRIFAVLNRFKNSDNFHFLKSIDHRSFITLMKHSAFLIGNSSAGIREASTLGIPSINLGTRQNGRFQHKSIKNVCFNKQEIEQAISWALKNNRFTPSHHFGQGRAAHLFLKILNKRWFWDIQLQKYFKQ